jgi:hypothetical protein
MSYIATSEDYAKAPARHPHSFHDTENKEKNQLCWIEYLVNHDSKVVSLDGQNKLIQG